MTKARATSTSRFAGWVLPFVVKTFTLCHPERSPHPAPRDEAESMDPEGASFAMRRQGVLSMDCPRKFFLFQTSAAPKARNKGSPGRKPWVDEKMILSPGGATQERLRASTSAGVGCTFRVDIPNINR